MIASLDKKEVLEIHGKIVESSGEELSILSKHKIDSIIIRHNRAETIAKKATILLHDIPHLQPFSEGNKRTAFASTIIFLKYNKKNLKLSRKRIKEIIIYSVNNNLTLRDIEKILEKAIV